MNLDKQLTECIVDTIDLMGGKQLIFRFKNGYGASLVNHSRSYGTELAVIKFDKSGGFSLNYKTPITDDVLGYLDVAQATKALYAIKDL